ncbi:TonB-dependent receptor [Rudaea sp.]|uniref:TonB-dependent receptor domain-containing protein n=1 Tax=Rudaea sp. TaxID=2136325 RepID=UPI0032205053
MRSRKLISFGVVSTLALSISAALVANAHAQEKQGTEKEETQKLGEVSVTGSAIRTAPDEVVVPVVTIDAEKIAQSGVATNALELLRKTIPAFAGRSNAGDSNANNNNQNTAGGSQVQLRNLPTLVLINGRRVANSGIGGINGKNFVDIGQIPAQAVDRIEVLADGASSLYGSDAVGGVVNFILKSDYEGVTAGARWGDADGNYSQRSAWLTGGGSFAGVKVVATLSANLSDPLAQDTRSFTSPLYGKTSSIPGAVGGAGYLLNGGLYSPRQNNPVGAGATAGSINDLVNNGTYLKTTPGEIAAGFDISPYQTLLMRQNKLAFTANLSKTLIEDKLEAFGDVEASSGRSFTRWLPVAATGITVPTGVPYNPLTTPFSGVAFTYLPYTHNFYNDVTAYRATAGLRGHFSEDWSWEAAAVYSRSNLEQTQTNLIYKPNLAKAIAGGFDANGNAVAGGAYSKVYGGYSLSGPLVLQPALDPFARAAGVDPASLANLYGNELINASSQLLSFDASVNGKLFHLPADEVEIAMGVSGRRETLSGRADANGRVTDPVTGSTTGNDQQWQGGTFADPFSRSRNIYGAFAELRVPITGKEWNFAGANALDLTLAGREEKYSDAGSSFVPKIGFRWEPFDKQFIVRSSYSKSFSAPSLYAMYGPTDTRQVGAGVIQGVFGANYTAMPFNGEDGNNPSLKPAKSTSKLLGFTVRPNFVPGLSVAVDYSNITLKGFAGGIGFNTILTSINQLGSASPYFANLAIDAFPGQTGATQPFTHPGDLLAFLTSSATGKGDPNQANRLYVIDQFRNLASLTEHSFTVSADYTIPTDHFGTFRLSTAGAVFNKFNFQPLPGGAYIEYAGHTNNAGASGGFGGTLPKYRFYSTLNWSDGNWDVTLGNTYSSAASDTGVNGTSTPEIHVSSYVAWDLRVGYDIHPANDKQIKDIKVAVGMNNIANRMPPLAPRAFVDNNADVATYSPLGRLTYASVEVQF